MKNEQSSVVFRVPGFVDADGIEYTDIEVIVEMDGDIRDTVQLVKTLERPPALMSLALAGLLVAKLNNTGHHAETCELLCDENSTIHSSLVDLGRNFRRHHRCQLRFKSYLM